MRGCYVILGSQGRLLWRGSSYLEFKEGPGWWRHWTGWGRIFVNQGEWNTFAISLSSTIENTVPCTLAAKWLQLCSTLCDPTECSPPGSSVHGILKERKLEWVATSSSRGSFWPRDWTRVSCGFCTTGTFFNAEPLGKPALHIMSIQLIVTGWMKSKLRLD